MTSTRRKVFAAGGIAVALLASLVVAIPFLLRGRIDGWLQEAIAGRVDASVTWESAGLSLIRDFPDASLQVEDLRVVGVGPFAADTLAVVPQLGVAIELPSLIRALRGTGPLVIRSVSADAPVLRLLVLDSGAKNWDVLPPPTDAPSEGTLDFTLQNVEVRDARLTLENRQIGLNAEIRGLHESLSGDFRQQRFSVESGTTVDSASVRFAGVPYLSDAKLNLTTVLDVDGSTGTVSISSGELRLNDLVLALSGDVAIGADTTNLDIAFQAPDASVSELVSLVSPLYANGNLAEARTTGTVSAGGWVRGPLASDAFPSFQFDARIDGGSLQYPDLPLPLSAIALDLSLRNPGGDVDSTRIEVRRFSAAAGGSTVEGAFSMTTPVTDPNVALEAEGRLDLAAWNRALPLASEGELEGVISGDAQIAARMSDVTAERYDRISADGVLEVAGLDVRTAAIPHPLSIESARLQLSPSFAELSGLRGTVGSTDLAVDGRVENPLSFALGDGVLRGTMDVRSASMNLDEWKSDDEMAFIAVPERIDFTLTTAIDQLQYANLPLTNARGAVRILDQRATLEDFVVDVFGGSLTIDGFYETVDPTQPTFDVDVRMASVDVAQAASALNTVRTLAPISQYAEGRVTTDLRLSGTLGQNMAPVLELLTGQGSLETDAVSLQGFPALTRLADRLKTTWLSDPTLSDIQATFSILDGRLHVRPFDVELGEFATTVAGSQGIDQTMDYALDLKVPRSVLGTAANEAISSLASRVSGGAAAFASAAEVTLGARITGTIADPSIALEFQGAGGVGEAVRAGLEDARDQAVAEMETKFDSVAAAARQRAEAEAAGLIAEAERQAETIRTEAQALAERARTEGYAQADALAARGGNPVEQRLSQAAANRLRAETDQRADDMIQAADTRASQLLEEARRRAEELTTRAAAGEGD